MLAVIINTITIPASILTLPSQILRVLLAFFHQWIG